VARNRENASDVSINSHVYRKSAFGWAIARRDFLPLQFIAWATVSFPCFVFPLSFFLLFLFLFLFLSFLFPSLSKSRRLTRSLDDLSRDQLTVFSNANSSNVTVRWILLHLILFSNLLPRCREEFDLHGRDGASTYASCMHLYETVYTNAFEYIRVLAFTFTRETWFTVIFVFKLHFGSFRKFLLSFTFFFFFFLK
jgi:hypothetical protein